MYACEIAQTLKLRFQDILFSTTGNNPGPYRATKEKEVNIPLVLTFIFKLSRN